MNRAEKCSYDIMTTLFRFSDNGDIIVFPSEEAKRVKEASKKAPRFEDPNTLVSFDEAYDAGAPENTVLQHTQYKGQSFKWVLQNDPSYVIYLARDYIGKSLSDMKTDREKIHCALVTWALSFEEFKRAYDIWKNPKNMEERHDKVIGFGQNNGRKYQVVYESLDPLDVSFINSVKSTEVKSPKSSFAQFKQYILDRDALKPCPNLISIPDDVIDTVEVDSQIIQEKTGASSMSDGSKGKKSDKTEPELFPKSLCSPAQKAWMAEELKSLGLLPGHRGYNESRRLKGKPLLRIPPVPEMQVVPVGSLPKPDPFWIHPMFVWFPTKTLTHLTPNHKFSCIRLECRGRAKMNGLGNARCVIGSGTYSTGMPNCSQYYIVCSELICDICGKRWQASDPDFLKSLPDLLKTMYPAHVGYKKMVCKSVVDMLHRGGLAISQIASELKRFAHGRYEMAHKQYLALTCMTRHHLTSLEKSSLVSVKRSKHEPNTPFGSFEDASGYHGAEVSEDFLRNLLIAEYVSQKNYLVALQKGIFGKFLRCDHTRSVAKKVELLTGAMWSYAVMNEYWEIVSWMLCEGDGEKHQAALWSGLKTRYELSEVPLAEVRWVDKFCCLAPPYTTTENRIESPVQSPEERNQFRRKSACRVHYNPDIEELLDGFHLISRLGKACVSDAHAAYPKFMESLSDAIYLVDEEDEKRLMEAWVHVKKDGVPSKATIRKHCKTRIPPCDQLILRVEQVVNAFRNVKDSDGLYLYSVQMENAWALQKIHILRSCLSDPPNAEYNRVLRYEQLGKNQSEKARLPVYQGVRSSSQLEGFHFHQNKYVTGDKVRGEFWQAQMFFEVSRWNQKRATEHREHKYPLNYDPKLTYHLNHYHQKEYDVPKYPDVVMNFDQTNETFGFEYLQENQSKAMVESLYDEIEEPESSPVKHKKLSLRGKQPGSKSSLESSIPGSYPSADLSLEQSVHLAPQPSVELGHDVTKLAPNPSPDIDLDMSALASDPSRLSTASSDNSTSISTKSASSGRPATRRKATKRSAQPCSTNHQLCISDSASPSDEASDSLSSTRKPPLSKIRSGNAQCINHTKWSTEMKNLIIELLSKHSEDPEKYSKVIKEYNCRMMHSQFENHSSNQLWHTSSRFIQFFDRDLNRSIDSAQSLSSSSVNVPELQASLKETSTVSSTSLPEPKKPLCSTRSPDSTDVINLIQNIVEPSDISESDVQERKKVRKRAPASEKSGSNATGRNCLECGKPKAKSSGVNNLHSTFKRPGVPCIFYCPVKMNRLYGTPLDMTFDEFHKTDTFKVALEDVAKQKREKEELKERRKQEREAKSLKAPGPQPKKQKK